MSEVEWWRRSLSNGVMFYRLAEVSGQVEVTFHAHKKEAPAHASVYHFSSWSKAHQFMTARKAERTG